MTFESILKKKRVYFVMLVLALWLGCVPSPSFALPISSSGDMQDYTNDRDLVDSFLAQEAVSQRLAKMGLSREEISSRLDKLSETQIHQLAENVERLKAGSNGDVFVAILIVLILIGIVLFFLTHTIHVEPKEPEE